MADSIEQLDAVIAAIEVERATVGAQAAGEGEGVPSPKERLLQANYAVTLEHSRLAMKVHGIGNGVAIAGTVDELPGVNARMRLLEAATARAMTLAESL